MSYAFETVTERMGVVIKRVDAPFVTNMRMMMEFDSVNNWVSHSRIGMFYVDFGSQ